MWKLASMRWCMWVRGSRLTELTEENKPDIVVRGEELGNITCLHMKMSILAFPGCWTSTFSTWAELQKRRLEWKYMQNGIFKLFLMDKPVGWLEHFLQQPSMLKFSNSFEPHPNSNLVSLFSLHVNQLDAVCWTMTVLTHFYYKLFQSFAEYWVLLLTVMKNNYMQWLGPCQKAHTQSVDLTGDMLQFIFLK